jgi:hypothetical protein
MYRVTPELDQGWENMGGLDVGELTATEEGVNLTSPEERNPKHRNHLGKLAVLLAAITLANAAPASANVQKEGQGPIAAAASHDFKTEIGGQDEAGVTENINGRADAILELAEETGVTAWRMTVTPSRMHSRVMREKMDETVDRVAAHHMRLNLAISCGGHWDNGRQFGKYIKHVIERYPAHTDALCNEPDQNGWLRAMDGHSRTATYWKLFTKGYDVINNSVKDPNIIFGNISTHGRRFWDDEMRYMEARKGNDFKKFIIYAAGINPYQFTTPPNKPTPNDPTWGREIGIGSIGRLEKRVKKAYRLGILQTRDGKKPPIVVGEYNYQRGIDHNQTHAYRNLRERTRVKWAGKVMNKVCRFKSFSWYQWDEEPLDQGGRKVWNTPLIKFNGQPYPELSMIKFKIQTLPCIEHPKTGP